jgi:hypothetical protein
MVDLAPLQEARDHRPCLSFLSQTNFTDELPRLRPVLGAKSGIKEVVDTVTRCFSFPSFTSPNFNSLSGQLRHVPHHRSPPA